MTLARAWRATSAPTIDGTITTAEPDRNPCEMKSRRVTGSL